MMGLPALRQAVAENTKRFLGLDIDWEREVMGKQKREISVPPNSRNGVTPHAFPQIAAAGLRSDKPRRSVPDLLGDQMHELANTGFGVAVEHSRIVLEEKWILDSGVASPLPAL